MKRKHGYKDYLNFLIIVFLISLCLLSAGVFYSNCLIFQGYRHLEKQETIQAGADFITAARVNPFDIYGRYCFGVALHADKDYAGAVEYYDQVIKRDPYYLQVRELRNKALPK